MTVDYDDLWTRTWGGMQDIGPVHRHTARIIVDTLRPLGISSVLDVGCGNGANLAAIQQELGIVDVAGIDVSASALDAARARVRGEFRIADLEHERIPFDRTFDLVLCDVTMSDISGLAIYDETRREVPWLARRFVFMTGGAIDEQAREVLRLTDRPHLEKPFHREDVERVLAAVRGKPPAPA